MSKLFDTKQGKTLGALALAAVVIVPAVAFLSQNKVAEAPTETAAVQEIEAAAGNDDAAKKAAQEEAEQAAMTFAADDVEPGNPVVAKVNGQDITRVDVYKYVKTLPENIRQMPPQAVYPLALDQVINTKLIQNKAETANLENDADVQEQLAHAKEQIIRSIYIQREVDSQITDEKLKATYQQYIDQMGDNEERHARHILVADEAKAKELIAKLKKGEKFEELAKANSTGPTGANGGDLGWFTQGDMVPEFSEAVFALKKGDVTKEPVKTQFGWHVIKLEDIRQQEKPKFEELKPYLQVQLRKEVLENLVGSWREEANVERFDINGKPIEPSAGGDAAPAEGSN